MKMYENKQWLSWIKLNLSLRKILINIEFKHFCGGDWVQKNEILVN